MKVSVFGLGYVGCVSMGCLAQDGHQIIGVDVNTGKVDLINQGKATIIEKNIDNIIEKAYSTGNISATTDSLTAVLNTDISIIAVGTPSSEQGHLNLEYIRNTAENIGKAIKEKGQFHIISIRSTVLPGTNKDVGDIIEKISNKKRNIDFAVVSNPEFLREGSAVEDFYNPAYTVLGSDNENAISKMQELYYKVNAPFRVVSIDVAELLKYVNNSFHALKISFANEVGNICKKLGIDSHELMGLFSDDDRLNTSKAYLKPGFAYGGSCLPKDLLALNTIAHDFYLQTPVLQSINQSNEIQKDIVLKEILATGIKKVGVVGISFKAGTDDLRYSPIVDVIERLIGKGIEIKVYDSNVHISKLIGKNRSYIMHKLPHISNLMVNSIEELVEYTDLLVITNKTNEIEFSRISADKLIYDLARIESFRKKDNYMGISW